MSLDTAGIVFAFTAGLLSIFSPCGYALLPGYISYYLGSDFSVVKAVTGGLVCTLGLMTLYSVVGVLASGLGAVLSTVIPVVNLVAGLLMIAMGVATLLHVNIPFIQVGASPSRRQGLVGLYLFGLVYGIAGVGCSAPVFISVFFYALSGGALNGVLTFLVYSLGMGLPLIVTSVLVARAKEVMIGRISKATERLQRVSGVVLVAVGIYLLFYNYIYLA
jgi:cytochrome c-type biogenesis protein